MVTIGAVYCVADKSRTSCITYRAKIYQHPNDCPSGSTSPCSHKYRHNHNIHN
ncbi:hypothetical protein BDV30DRAFT_206895 [Aspergillus minisclerotigenes]|uniref:Uncharacterized protein n=1 Tax=Aspergillus minisclerotigenes TaxID=656917 RepID=A0A5N6JBJ8_9EURO|nr:hypothetical protein BDV30DRAFT_206895 [Aspergillus minisclerotigenes]